MPAKKKAEPSEEEGPEPAAEEEVFDLTPIGPAPDSEVAALKQQVEDLTLRTVRELEDLRERVRVHFRHHHKFESSVWKF